MKVHFIDPLRQSCAAGSRCRAVPDAIARRCDAPARPAKPPPPRADSLVEYMQPSRTRSLVARVTMSAATIHFVLLLVDYFSCARALESRKMFRFGDLVAEASAQKLVERLRRGSVPGHAGGELRDPQETHNRARARHPGMHLP